MSYLKGYDLKSIHGINSSSYEETFFPTSFKFFYRNSGKAFDSSKLSTLSTPSNKTESVNLKSGNGYSLSYKKTTDVDEDKENIQSNQNSEKLKPNNYCFSYNKDTREKCDKYNKYDYSYDYDYGYDTNYHNYKKNYYSNNSNSNQVQSTTTVKQNNRNNETFDEYKAKLCLLNEIYNPNDYFNLISLLRYPSELPKNCAYIVFKDGFYPYWESNPNGGKLSLYLSSNEVDNVWELITYLFVCYNEIFIKEVPLVGLVLKMAGSTEKKLELQFWFSHNDQDKCKDFINSLYNLLIAYGLPGIEMKALAYKSFY